MPKDRRGRKTRGGNEVGGKLGDWKTEYQSLWGSKMTVVGGRTVNFGEKTVWGRAEEGMTVEREGRLRVLGWVGGGMRP